MAPARQNVSGRSPLVNQQRQITAFFSKNISATPSPSPSPSPNICKRNPNPKSKPSLSPPNSSPTTPSPIQSKSKKPLLVIGQSPLTPDAKLYGEEVLGRRIRVYWPLDKTWYDGVVKSFDMESGSHLVCYDDAEEESLDLGKEKFEWVEESTRFKRLRRGGSLAIKRMVIEDDEVENVDEKTDGLSDGSSDEDWGKKNEDKEASEDTDEDDMDLVDEKEETEEEEEEEKLAVAKGKRGKKNESLKRKANGGGNQDTAKKSKTSEDASKGKSKVSAMEPVKVVGSK